MAGRLLMKADIRDWGFRSTGQVSLVILCPDLNRLIHPQWQPTQDSCLENPCSEEPGRL